MLVCFSVMVMKCLRQLTLWKRSSADSSSGGSRVPGPSQLCAQEELMVDAGGIGDRQAQAQGI